MRGRAGLAVATALLLGACGLNTTSKDGDVGDTLSAGGLKVTVSRVDSEVRGSPGHDFSGLGTPADGMRFFGVKVKVCTDRGQAIGTFNFKLDLDGDNEARARFPQSVYSDDFDTVRDGCGSGWLVFEGPKGSAAEKVSFKYDDTGSAQPGADKEKHARFSWKVA